MNIRLYDLLGFVQPGLFCFSVGSALLAWLYLFLSITALLGKEDQSQIREFQFGAVRLSALGAALAASLAGVQAAENYRSFLNAFFGLDPRIWLIGGALIVGPGILAGCCSNGWLNHSRRERQRITIIRLRFEVEIPRPDEFH
ncbi:hypothetical protein [Stratiformator vulcanicus]|uniref:Uncharacterized protein n=1 Tax=Stratiformator vulcanicus TaxID=2527980 RepID=A0A517QZG7_9PLAN|nr:hypothetical protein [Stratiformator vulcanicus]QDT36998.1 hypothetical protein Pan189_13630 [Stratiformator vulcanicus]